MPLTNLAKFPAIAAVVGMTVAAAPFVGSAAGQSYDAPPSGAVAVPAYQAGGTTTPISPVSMRAGPNIGEPVIGTLRPGMPLQILATANYGWMQVQTPVGTGWVYGSYLASGTGAPMAFSGPQPQPQSNPQPQPRPDISSP